MKPSCLNASEDRLRMVLCKKFRDQKDDVALLLEDPTMKAVLRWFKRDPKLMTPKKLPWLLRVFVS